MPYVPYNREQTAFQSGIQILASMHFQYTTEGGTLDAAAIGNRKVLCGEPFVRNTTTGRYVPFVAATHVTGSALNAGFADPVLIDVDFFCDGVHNVVVGALIWKGEVYAAKLPASVTAAFKSINPFIRYNTRGF